MKWLELDEDQRNHLVATRVMGWQTTHCSARLDDISEFIGGWLCDRCGFQGSWGEEGIKEIDNHMTLPPRYSARMDAAWKIIGRMAEHPQRDQFGINLFLIEVGPIILNSGSRQQFAVTRLARLTPEIICVAALRTLRVIVGEVGEIDENQDLQA